MLEPLLLTIAVITVPFGLYLAFDRKPEETTVRRRINRHERTREALKRLAQSENHWELSHLRFDLRQAYRNLQKLRLQGQWADLEAQVTPGPIQEWKKEWERRAQEGLVWHLDPLEIVDVQPVNLQNRAGYEKDFVTVEIETRRREYLRGPKGYYREGSGQLFESPEDIPIELAKEFWTFVRRADHWALVRCDRDYPEALAFVDEEEPDEEA